MSRDRVVVTGASGFIGRQMLPHLAECLEVHALTFNSVLESTDDIVFHQADLLDRESLARLIPEIRPSYLVHLAWTTKHGKFWHDPLNIDWLEASIECVRLFGRYGGKRAVIVGTSAEYASHARSPLSEEAASIGPASLYGSMKVALHQAARSLSETYGFTLAWPRLFHLYGAREAQDRLVPQAISAALAGKPLECQRPNLVLDFIDVRDLGRALSELLISEVTGAINLGSGTWVRIRDLVSWIDAATNDDASVPFPQFDSNDLTESIVPDLHRMKNELRFVPEISLAAGVEDAIRWWRSNAH